MPGPGGGAGGGGGSRGGGFGGGFGGGGFGHRPSHHHYHRPGFFFWGPRRYYGGGCLGGLVGMIFLPIIAIILSAILLITSVISAFSIAGQGGVVVYDENKFQDYADNAYAEEFGIAGAYEDNILLVFTVDEEYYNYYYIAWVGDHVERNINYMFGANNTELGRAINASVNQKSYKYSLDSNLADVVDTMAEKIEARGLANSFTCNEPHAQVKSHLTNKAEIDMTHETVNSALEDFTERTGISIVLVVDEEEDVFGKTMPAGTIITIVISLVILVLAAFWIFKAIKYRNGGPNDNNMFDDKNFG